MYGQHTRLENEILNKILSYHFFVESYTFFCIFCQARPRVSDCVLHAIPTQRHATVTVGPGDEAGTSMFLSPPGILVLRHPDKSTQEGKTTCLSVMLSTVERYPYSWYKAVYERKSSNKLRNVKFNV